MLISSDPSFFARVAQDAGFIRPDPCGPVSERLLGRLYEVHKLCAAFGTAEEWAYVPQHDAAGHVAIAAARGTLVHRARLENDVIAAYAIETPTAAMLGEAGALACFLRAIALAPAADEAMLRLGLLAFDPCVPYEVQGAQQPVREVSHA